MELGVDRKKRQQRTNMNKQHDTPAFCRAQGQGLNSSGLRNPPWPKPTVYRPYAPRSPAVRSGIGHGPRCGSEPTDPLHTAEPAEPADAGRARERATASEAGVGFGGEGEGRVSYVWSHLIKDVQDFIRSY